jgi:pimeloyl-ACP methyl ester carboxylesterase
MQIPRFVASDGLLLAAETFGEGRPLVFAPGLTDNRGYIRRQLLPLADRYRIVTYDQRGHGDSTPVTDPTLYTPERMAGDMARILDAFDIGRAVIGGESMGAATALLFAFTWPKRVESLLLTGPALGDTANPGRDRLKALGQAFADRGVESIIAEAAATEWPEMGLDENAMTTLSAMLRSHQDESIAAACEAVADWTLDLAPLSTVRCPVQIIAWEDDPVHPIALARRMAGLLPSARLSVLSQLNSRFNSLELIGRIYREFLLGLAAN